MKQGLSPAVVVAIIVVVVVIIGAIGYFAVLKPKGSGGKISADEQQQMQQKQMQKMQGMTDQRKSQPKGGMGPAPGPPPGG